MDDPSNNSGNALPDSVSFACGGWLYLYMFGVARALQTRGLDRKFRYAGCSAGALCSAGLALRGNFDNAIKYVKDDCIPSVYQSFWNLFSLAKYISTCLNNHCNLHKWKDLTPGQLEVAVTNLPFLNAERVTSYVSEEDLRLSLLASAAVFPLAPLVYRRGRWCVDGGISDFQPVMDENTIRVSPLYFADADIKPSRYIPLWWAVVPPRSIETVDWLYRLGYDDACKWLDSHNIPQGLPDDIYTNEPMRKPHPYDIPRRISFDRFFGYDLNELMNEYVSYTIDMILIILVVCILKPFALILVYLDLLVMTICYIALITIHEIIELYPMILLCIAFFLPYYQLILFQCCIIYLCKLFIVGPTSKQQLSKLYECITCIGSLSLLSRFISCTLSHVELKKHKKLSKMSIMYRIVRHSL